MDKTKDKREKRNINKEEVTIKHYTLIEWLNSLTSLVESSSVATYPTKGVRAESQRSVFQKGKPVGVATNIYSRKTLEEPKRGLRILKIRVRELFMHGEGISTPRAHHKG